MKIITYFTFSDDADDDDDDDDRRPSSGGRRTTTRRPTTTTRSRGRDKEDDDEELCNDATVDAIVTVKDGTTYTFKGSQGRIDHDYLRLSEYGI